MKDNEWDALLSETLGAPVERPPYLDARLRGELAAARETPKGLSLWWLPLALSLGTGLAALTLGLVLPPPGGLILALCAAASVAAAAIFTAVGLLCFDLREKGRVLSCQL